MIHVIKKAESVIYDVSTETLWSSHDECSCDAYCQNATGALQYLLMLTKLMFTMLYVKNPQKES